MRFAATKTELNKILPLRVLFLQEFNRQFINNAFHERGWAGSYLLTIDSATVGYGSIQGHGPLWICRCRRCSTNSPASVKSDTVLFEDHLVTKHVIAGAVLRHSGNENWMWKPTEAVGEYVLELGGEVVASVGFLLHYNKPFADLWMEVREEHQRRGLGSYALQEVKKECYLAGRVPAARCNMKNPASRACLIRAGMRVCGFVLIGQLRSAE
jgi:GNAT superfamily N-acetyltransferase